MKKVLVVGKYPDLLEVIEVHLIENNYKVEILNSEVQNIIDLFDSIQFDYLLLTGGVEANLRMKIIDYLNTKRREVKLVEHYGGPYTISESIKAIS